MIRCIGIMLWVQLDWRSVPDGVDPVALPEAAREMARIREATGPGDVAAPVSPELMVLQHLCCPSKADIEEHRAECRAPLGEYPVQMSLRNSHITCDACRIQIDLIVSFPKSLLKPNEEIGLVTTRKLSLAFPHHQSE